MGSSKHMLARRSTSVCIELIQSLKAQHREKKNSLKPLLALSWREWSNYLIIFVIIDNMVIMIIIIIFVFFFSSGSTVFLQQLAVSCSAKLFYSAISGRAVFLIEALYVLESFTSDPYPGTCFSH